MRVVWAECWLQFDCAGAFMFEWLGVISCLKARYVNKKEGCMLGFEGSESSIGEKLVDGFCVGQCI